MGPGESGDDDDEEAKVDHHHDEDGEVEKIEVTVSFQVEEAAEVSDARVEVWLWRKCVLQDEEDGGQDDPHPPATHRVEQESRAMRGVALNFDL